MMEPCEHNYKGYVSLFEHSHSFSNLKEGKPCCDMGQNDTIGKIELIPSSVLSTDNTNCCNDIHKFLQQFE